MINQIPGLIQFKISHNLLVEHLTPEALQLSVDSPVFGQSNIDFSEPEQSKLSKTKLELDGGLPYKSLAALFDKASIAVVNPSILQTT